MHGLCQGFGQCWHTQAVPCLCPYLLEKLIWMVMWCFGKNILGRDASVGVGQNFLNFEHESMDSDSESRTVRLFIYQEQHLKLGIPLCLRRRVSKVCEKSLDLTRHPNLPP